MVSTLHPLQRRYLVEDLFRQRRSDEQRRYIGSQRAARIDPNPHQIDAVVFALSRLPEGGCILADEVGLGKTIEAGLVMAQMLAEGAHRVLLVTPKALLGQWQNELYNLFNIETREGSFTPGAFTGRGVFLAGRELVCSEKGSELLTGGERFDLVVVDEAHEVFAGIYKRFDRWGNYQNDSPHATMAGRFRQILDGRATPVLLLTATPIQNSLSELWGLVHYVDPTSTLLGDLHTFREVFCDGDDRRLAIGQGHELRKRMRTVVQRTLRRQAQDFMERPFVGRVPQTFEYSMSREEKDLYDDLTAYLLDPNILAFRGSQRSLLLISFHRAMASSTRALISSLEKVADRLGGKKTEDIPFPELDLDNVPEVDEAPPPKPQPASAELERVRSFIQRAKGLSRDSKAAALLDAVKLTLQRGEDGSSDGKLVIFTEFLATQEYLRDLLVQSGILQDEQITLFQGTNDSPRAAQALARWEKKMGDHKRPSRDVAVRQALVDEFASENGRVFISTEAGGKGLNLQFCSTVVNYDLPWNPQRIEQRIGRCHRYGQKNGVTVINFLVEDNAAQRLTYEILSLKFELFGTVLGASDQVLRHEDPETLAGLMGADFEAELRKIHLRARSLEEVEADLRKLRDTIESRRHEFEEAHRRTTDVIESHLDESVQQVFRRIQDEVAQELLDFDNDLERVVVSYLEALQVPYQRQPAGGNRRVLQIEPSPRLPEGLREGARCLLGRSAAEGDDPLHLGHPLVAAVLEEARESTSNRQFRLKIGIPEDAAELAPYRGRLGRLILAKVLYGGFEPTERLLVAIVLEGDAEPLEASVADRLLHGTIEECTASYTSTVSPEDVDDAFQQLVFETGGDVKKGEDRKLTVALAQIERFFDDKALLLRRQIRAVADRLGSAEEEVARAIGAELRTKAENQKRKLAEELEDLEKQLALIEARDDELYRRLREQVYERRYSEPKIEWLVEAEVQIA